MIVALVGRCHRHAGHRRIGSGSRRHLFRRWHHARRARAGQHELRGEGEKERDGDQGTAHGKTRFEKQLVQFTLPYRVPVVQSGNQDTTDTATSGIGRRCCHALYLLRSLFEQSMTSQALDREALVSRGLRLNYLTIGYNVVEALVSLVSGLLAGSVALVGFGVDSVIEVSASIAAQWRLRADIEPSRRVRVERITVRVVGCCFLLLALYVSYDSLMSLAEQAHPSESRVGIALTALSAIVMPVLARAKRTVALGMSSRALVAEARQTSLCAYLSAIVLGGLALNAMLGWWWADPVAALCMVPIIVKEGLDGLRGDVSHDDCC